MTMISVEKDFLIDLLDSKLHIIRQEMKKILDKWNYKSVDKFISDARSRSIEEAEDDAVCIRGLVFNQEKLLDHKKKWNK